MDVSETGDEGGSNQSAMTDPLNVSQGLQPSVGACQLDDFGKVTVSIGIQHNHYYLHPTYIACYQVLQGTREDSSPSDLSKEDENKKMVRLAIRFNV